MLDSRYLRADIEEAAQRLAKRKFTLDVAKLTDGLKNAPMVALIT